MRVLLVTGSYPPMACGVGDYTRSLARALAACPGVEVAVLTSAAAAAGPGDGDLPGPGRERAPAPGPHLFPMVRHWSLGAWPAVRRVVREWHPDLVHLQFPGQGYDGPLAWLLPLLLTAMGVRVVQTWHEYFPGARRVALWQLALAAAPGALVVVRPGYQAQMPGWFRRLAGRGQVHFVPNAPTLPRVELTAGERAAVRARLAPPGKRLLAFFGFCYEHKGLDDLLALLDPEVEHLVLIGELQLGDPYQAALRRRLEQAPLASHVTLTGFLPDREAARVLAAVDAVVLPFRQGGGPWNTSLKAAALQGTFVLTTALDRHGFDAEENAYYARIRDTADLRHALTTYQGRRDVRPLPPLARPGWSEIARAHLAVYRGEPPGWPPG